MIILGKSSFLKRKTGNHIEDEGCAALAKMLSENTTLRRLYLGGIDESDLIVSRLTRFAFD